MTPITIQVHVTILLVVRLCSSLAYFMMTQPPSHSRQIAYKNFGC